MSTVRPSGASMLRYVILTGCLIFVLELSCAAMASDVVWFPQDIKETSMERLVNSIQKARDKDNRSRLLSISDSLQSTVGLGNKNDSVLADLYYYTGVCELLLQNRNEAIKWLNISVRIKRELGVVDKQLGNSLINLAGAFMYLEDYNQVIFHINQFLNFCPDLYGENSQEEAEGFSVLIGSYIQMKDWKKFLDFSFKALEIVSANSNSKNWPKLSYLYTNIGTGYTRKGDFSKGRIYLEEAEAIYRKQNLGVDDNFIGLINNLGLTYGYLGLTEKEKEYLENGTRLAVKKEDATSFNLINSFAIRISDEGFIEKGESILTNLIKEASDVFKRDSLLWLNVMGNFADYLAVYSGKLQEALQVYSHCIKYIEKDSVRNVSSEKVVLGYAESLLKTGETEKALSRVNDLIFNYPVKGDSYDLYRNPPVDSLKADRLVLNAIQLKYRIIKKIFSETGDAKVMEAAARNSELVISLIDRMRAGISEEESRVVLGDRYRDSYLNAVNDFLFCYKSSGSSEFLEKTFEYMERSKAAGLLASTREMSALQFHIPQLVGELEINLQREIGNYNAMISKEKEQESPNTELLTYFNESQIKLLKSRDSLLLTFEKEYPAYYRIKYNSEVPGLMEIPGIIGRNNNYLNYVVADSVIYLFLVNRKHRQVESIKVDSSFFSDLKFFRSLLANPSPSLNARSRFNDFQKIGHRLFKTLIDPVQKNIISENLIISTDNLLSYIPFETLLISEYKGSEILYRELDYLMNSFNISYTYSAAFIDQMKSRDHIKTRELIAFAPVYQRSMNLDSIFNKRQNGSILYSLPFSQDEAEYVSEVTGGKLYLNGNARESVFKKEAGTYNIIHLAMHTVLNDQNPMNSAMIFSPVADNPEDGFLYTWEVYGIPLRSRLVVLSSCNTGFGKLSSGEGILSLARGFLYSGSRSVVMSMWEVEDKAGTEIVKMFYENLIKGKKKSIALRNARIRYLKNARQLESHPYFWSTLVVYGEDEPVYHNKYIFWLLVSIVTLPLFVLGYYFMKRRYS